MDFTAQIINWYKNNRRSLPWRDDPKPYYVWLSEVIMQQTRMDQGLKYWQKFVDKFPRIEHLANAEEETVMKLWQGLGYYNRARNLHATSRYITHELNGEFPNTYKGLLSLKGVGPYTAAAVGSISFGLPYPSIDGNVMRVLSRYFGVLEPVDETHGRKTIEALAEEHIDQNDPGTYNQAVMEFGALICTPKKPSCSTCPLQEGCFAFRHKQVHDLPRKVKKTKQRNRYFNFLVAGDDSHIYMEKRSEGDIWANLYQFPLVETQQKVSNPQLLSPNYEIEFTMNQVHEKPQEYKHVLSHQIIYARFWKVNPGQYSHPLNKLKKIHIEDIDSYAVPRLIERYLKDEELLD